MICQGQAYDAYLPFSLTTRQPRKAAAITNCLSAVIEVFQQHRSASLGITQPPLNQKPHLFLHAAVVADSQLPQAQ